MRRSSAAQSASIASRPAFVTIARAPLLGTGRREYGSDLGLRRSEIFLKRGLDSRIRKLPVGQISGGRTNKSRCVEFQCSRRAPEIFGQRAVGQGFGQMRPADLVRAVEVGERAGDAQHAMIAARR